MEGLQAVMGMMAKRKFRIHRGCKETIKGIETHVWDPNKAKRGIEEPLKQNDDAADMVRYSIASKCTKWRYAG
jgi:phage terminase large subunit